MEVVSGMVAAAWSLRLLFELVSLQPLNKLEVYGFLWICDAMLLILQFLADRGGEGKVGIGSVLLRSERWWGKFF